MQVWEIAAAFHNVETLLSQRKISSKYQKGKKGKVAVNEGKGEATVEDIPENTTSKKVSCTMILLSIIVSYLINGYTVISHQ